jgi:hypothetical protein
LISKYLLKTNLIVYINFEEGEFKMKKLIINVFMVTALCLVTVGFVRTVVAQDVEPTITKVRTTFNTNPVVETKLPDTTQYEFRIDYDNGTGPAGVIIKDTIPAEWNVIEINGVAIDPLGRPGKGQTPIAGGSDSNGSYTVFRSGKDPKGQGPKPPKDSPKKNNSSTTICWTPVLTGPASLTVKVETRQSHSGNAKWAPTSCGSLVLNPGATAFVYDSNIAELVVVVGPTAPLNLVAYEDLNGNEDVDLAGAGEEDNTGLLDAVETGTGTF